MLSAARFAGSAARVGRYAGTASRYWAYAKSAARSKKAYLKYGAIGNELFHYGYSKVKKMVRRSPRSTGSRSRKRARYSPRSGRRVRRRRAITKRSRGSSRFKEIGYSATKKEIAKKNRAVAGNTTALNDYTLYTNLVSTFPSRENTIVDNLFQRERDTIWWSGFKMELFTRNVTSKIMVCNFAFVIPKATLAVNTTNFFRNEDSGQDSKDRDFSTSIRGMDLAHATINPDQYEIIKRFRITLGPKDNTGSIHPDKPNWTHYSKWISVNRKITFDDGSATIPDNGAVYMCTWYNDPEANTTNTPAASVLEQLLITNYWTEV